MVCELNGHSRNGSLFGRFLLNQTLLHLPPRWQRNDSFHLIEGYFSVDKSRRMPVCSLVYLMKHGEIELPPF